jgi:hypothetical protein
MSHMKDEVHDIELSGYDGDAVNMRCRSER